MDLRSVPGSPLLGWCWALCLRTTVPNVIILSAASDVTVYSLRTTAIAYTISTAMSIGVAVLIIMIMRRISGWQTSR